MCALSSAGKNQKYMRKKHYELLAERNIWRDVPSKEFFESQQGVAGAFVLKHSITIFVPMSYIATNDFSPNVDGV